MKMMKKGMALILALAMGISLVGCGEARKVNDDSSQNLQSEQTDNSLNETVVLDGITLTKEYAGTTLNLLWAPDIAFSKCLMDLLPEFENATGINVEVESLTDTEISRKLAIDSAAGGETLDVFYFRPAQETKMFSSNGWIYDISGLKEDPEYEFEDISEESLNVVMGSDGKLYGIPLTVERTMLFYNTEMFNEAGLDHAPETLEELIEYCDILHDPDNEKYALAMRGQGTAAVIAFTPFLYAFGGQYIDENNKACFNSPEAIKAFEYYATLITKYCAEGATSWTTSEASSMMRLGNCAMYIDYDSHYSFIVSDETSNISDKVAYAKMPSGDAGFTPCGPVAWAMGIAASTQNPEACEMFVKWATSKSVMLKAAELGQISGRLSATSEEVIYQNFDESYAKTVSESAKVANPVDRPFIVAGTEARQIIGEVIDYANAGHTGDDLKAFADDACVRVQTLIDSE